MEYKFFLFLDIISFIFCAIPNWNYDKIAIELSDTELEYTICSINLLGVTAITTKKITKNSTSVSYKNYIQVDNGEKK